MQKYRKGDHVRVAKDLGSCRSHFESDCDAIVIGSYADKFGGDDTSSYTIHIKGRGRVSWYEEDHLELIKTDCIGLLKEWEKEEEQESNMKSDLDWIFNNGPEVINNAHGATIEALASCFGLTNLWGSQGEGLIYLQNARGTLNMARPFLETGDKKGWIDHCKSIKA